jgi:hypothetical protein
MVEVLSEVTSWKNLMSDEEKASIIYDWIWEESKNMI